MTSHPRQLARALILLTLCAALTGCELLFQAAFIDRWACQSEREERCK